MKIGRRGLFGLGAVAVVAAPAVALAAKADVSAVDALDDALDADLADFARQYKAEFIAGFERQAALLNKAVVTEQTYAGGVYWIAEERPDGVFAHPIAEKE